MEHISDRDLEAINESKCVYLRLSKESEASALVS